MSETRPSFPFYARDWYISTRNLSAAARGAHMDLLTVAWIQGSVPGKPDELRRVACMEKLEWRKVWLELEGKWPLGEDGQRRNPKLEIVRAESAAFIEAARAAGKASVAARRQKYGTAAPPNGRSNGPSNDPPNDPPNGGVNEPVNNTRTPAERHVEPAVAVAVKDLPPYPPKGALGVGNGSGPWPRAAGTRAHPLDEDQPTPPPDDATRAVTWLDTFSAEHVRLRKSRFLSKPQRDYAPACALVAAYTDVELAALTALYLKASGEAFDSKSRTPGRLAEVAPLLEERLKEVGEWPRVA